MKKFCFFVLLILTFSLSASPLKVVIFRHGEKLDQKNPGPYLSDCGIARSLLLPGFLVESFGSPGALFAQGLKKTSSSFRPIQTMAPTSMYCASLFPENANAFTIQTQFTSSKVKELANALLTTKDYDGQIVFVCWSYKHIQKLATELGVTNAPPWPKKVYDWVWTITFDPNTGKVVDFTSITQPFTLDC